MRTALALWAALLLSACSCPARGDSGNAIWNKRVAYADGLCAKAGLGPSQMTARDLDGNPWPEIHWPFIDDYDLSPFYAGDRIPCQGGAIVTRWVKE